MLHLKLWFEGGLWSFCWGIRGGGLLLKKNPPPTPNHFLKKRKGGKQFFWPPLQKRFFIWIGNWIFFSREIFCVFFFSLEERGGQTPKKKPPTPKGVFSFHIKKKRGGGNVYLKKNPPNFFFSIFIWPPHPLQGIRVFLEGGGTGNCGKFIFEKRGGDWKFKSFKKIFK